MTMEVPAQTASLSPSEQSLKKKKQSTLYTVGSSNPVSVGLTKVQTCDRAVRLSYDVPDALIHQGLQTLQTKEKLEEGKRK